MEVLSAQYLFGSSNDFHLLSDFVIHILLVPNFFKLSEFWCAILYFFTIIILNSISDNLEIFFRSVSNSGKLKHCFGGVYYLVLCFPCPYENISASCIIVPSLWRMLYWKGVNVLDGIQGISWHMALVLVLGKPSSINSALFFPLTNDSCVCKWHNDLFFCYRRVEVWLFEVNVGFQGCLFSSALREISVKYSVDYDNWGLILAAEEDKKGYSLVPWELWGMWHQRLWL